ncbi:MAG: peptidoglycan bridge formation glycyltransferase FemA/FemB family protein [Parcubacteria group bacterium]|nr:peptidoglycan bridge formation glycyltransferase FemA/FemB family protein [Parcubacteria group bacterium]
MDFIFIDGTQKNLWDQFIAANAPDGGLLQSWNWGEFKQRLGVEVKRAGVLAEDGRLLLAASLFKQKFALIFQIFYISRGPVLDLSLWRDEGRRDEVLRFFFKEIKKMAESEKLFFLRMDPGWPSSLVPKEYLADFGFLRTRRAIQPIHTLRADLRYSKEELLSSMKPKTRYNIHLAEKKGLQVRESRSVRDADIFMNLLSKTAGRHSFKSYSKKYFLNLMEVFGGSLLIASYQGAEVAANWMIVFGKTAYYLYGASDYGYRNVMAPYLLHWEAMKRAKERGAEFYDFWGVAADSKEDAREDEWEGFSRLKRSFAPNQPIVEYAGTWELPYRKWLYHLLR